MNWTKSRSTISILFVYLVLISQVVLHGEAIRAMAGLKEEIAKHNLALDAQTVEKVGK